MLLRRVARPMLAALFITGGINALRAPEGHVQAAKPVLDAVSPAVDKAVEVAPIEQRPDDEMLVKIDAGVKIVAGSMLALGKFPRLASTALAASLIPTTLAGHRFWEETDPKAKAEQQIHFLKNVGLLGGLLIAAADTEGRPSLAWQGRRAARRAQAKLADLTDSTPDLGERLSGVTERVGSAAQTASGRVGSAAQVASERVGGAASVASDRIAVAAQDAGARVAPVAKDAGTAVSGLAAGLIGAAPGAGAAVSARASALSEEVGKRAAKARVQAEKRQAVWEKQAAKRRAELLKRTEKQRKQLAKRAAKKRAELEKQAPAVLERVSTQASTLGHDLAARASVVGHEIAHQAEGAAKDARKRVAALSA